MGLYRLMGLSTAVGAQGRGKDGAAKAQPRPGPEGGSLKGLGTTSCSAWLEGRDAKCGGATGGGDPVDLPLWWMGVLGGAP